MKRSMLYRSPSSPSGPEIAWRQIAAMRNFLIHEYFNIDEAVVEDVIANDLDPLSVAVNELLDLS